MVFKILLKIGSFTLVCFTQSKCFRSMFQADGMFSSEKHSGWSFAEKAFVKQSLKYGVQNFAQNWQLYPNESVYRSLLYAEVNFEG